MQKKTKISVILSNKIDLKTEYYQRKIETSHNDKSKFFRNSLQLQICKCLIRVSKHIGQTLA